MPGVEFGYGEVNMSRKGRYSFLTYKFLPLVLLLIFNPILGPWLFPLFFPHYWWGAMLIFMT